jgi:hypothetical protein
VSQSAHKERGAKVELRSYGKSLGQIIRPTRALGALLLLFTLFAALVQSGAITPKLVSPGSGTVGDNIYSVTVENVSWRNWTITRVHLADGPKSKELPDGSTLELGDLYRGQPLAMYSAWAEQRISTPVSLGKGKTFTVAFTRIHEPACKPASQQTKEEVETYEAQVTKLTVDVPVTLVVTTPLGSRNVMTNVSLVSGCPKS